MSTPNERLKAARAKHFDSAAEAARSMGIPAGTYAGHENGHRGFPAARAPQYARKFKVSEEWLLYGKGDAVGSHLSEDELERMLREVIERELTFETKVADLPRIVAPALREQIELYLAGRASTVSAQERVPDTAAQSPAATKPSEPEGSRT